MPFTKDVSALFLKKEESKQYQYTWTAAVLSHPYSTFSFRVLTISFICCMNSKWFIWKNVFRKSTECFKPQYVGENRKLVCKDKHFEIGMLAQWNCGVVFLDKSILLFSKSMEMSVFPITKLWTN